MKNLTIYSLLFLTFVCLMAVPSSNSFEIRNVLHKITDPVKSLFTRKETAEDENIVDAKEHGSLDFIGRDIVREASKKIKEIREDLSHRFSRSTQGLDCNRTFSNGVENFKSKVAAIYPGTKWCGDGNISESFNDLGRFSTTDKCCREHDMCPDNIPADSTKYGLDNTGLFTRSHCDCDKKFYECLKQAGGLVADSIGFTYFTVLGPQCFREDYPVVGCEQHRRGKCVEYLYDSREGKVFQWFDSPAF